MTDVNQWVFKEWQIASGNFTPRSTKIGRNIPAYNINTAVDCIDNQRAKMMCLNDTEMSHNKFNVCVNKINRAFEHIFPQKSTFEL